MVTFPSKGNMNEHVLLSCSSIIPKSYIQQSIGARNAITNQFQELISKGKLPADGWTNDSIALFLSELSRMDSNNFAGNVGVGEREGRVYSDLVRQRHYGFAHGIGRSGDVTAVQPKAAGSSLLNHLTNKLVLDSIRLAGFEPVVLENVLEADQLVTDLQGLEREIERLGPQAVLCVMSTTSCFAPRAVDDVEGISRLCDRYSIPHLINNAYGVQSSKCMHVIQQANKVGRVDAFVQSLDKNYMVPVGGAVVAGFDKSLVEEISQTYPGRASAAPSVDLLMTLLAMGSSGFKTLVRQRKEMYHYLKAEVGLVAAKYGERVLDTPRNPISIGVTLSRLDMTPAQLTDIGSMLFTRNVSGLRVVTGGDEKSINGTLFHGFGSHHKHYPVPYFTVAAAIGISEADVNTFCRRLDKVLSKAYGEHTTSNQT